MTTIISRIITGIIWSRYLAVPNPGRWIQPDPTAEEVWYREPRWLVTWCMCCRGGKVPRWLDSRGVIGQGDVLPATEALAPQRRGGRGVIKLARRRWGRSRPWWRGGRGVVGGGSWGVDGGGCIVVVVR
uniref:Uncharacterized protein n=1 Tax=Oryza meridionalis TaxID=40149 RepID=A0A0E0E7H2_9ORYZ